MTQREDGSKLWLRYAPLGNIAQNQRSLLREIRVDGPSPTNRIIERELIQGLASLLGQTVVPAPTASLVVGTPKNSSIVAGQGWRADLLSLGPEGFLIRTAAINGQKSIVIASQGEPGLLYGAFAFLRHIELGQSVDSLNISDRPRLRLRLLNHWDNLDGTIERGYAGRSLWKWDELPDTLSARYADYARACASVGINGSVLNNVNADPRILTSEYLRKVAALAEVFRPYCIRVFLSANFAAPKLIGDLPTNDPV
ncbi:MAG TPA: alpha-glucuronidase family glycosyl hydrolase, partial [Tepidisphaeraceae bacterium]|nr:alpha-glucuronidase family glycosyl hydrolase [Tepidisphaeraceae bacterium]